MKRHAQRAVCILGLLAAAACGAKTSSSVTAEEGGALRLVSSVNDDPRTRLELVVDRDVEFEQGTTLSVTVDSDGSGRALPRSVTIRGRELDVSDDELRIGERSYGRLEGPVEIRVRANGVYVNGELRGALDE